MDLVFDILIQRTTAALGHVWVLNVEDCRMARELELLGDRNDEEW